MAFNSLQYALFLPAVVGVYWLLRHRYQNAFLVGTSYVFYAAWDYRFLALLIISTLTDYWVGRALGRTEVSAVRGRLLAVSIAVNLGILAAFKYSGFFLDGASDLLGVLGFEAHRSFLRIVLPVGISFYTFQTISYSFDVYRRRIEPCRDLVAFAAYVSFFPQLVAGPIERARHLLPQIEAVRRRPELRDIAGGLRLILLGLVRKVVIADGVAPFVDAAFADPGQPSTALWIGALAFSVQIYGDFAGYTDIARGSARLLGIDLMVNFREPYLSRNVTEFWRRWHISLSTWLRDYLYVPLGGNRQGPLTTYRNLMITMLLGGLWHGAAWSFVVWGGLHGLWLAAHRFVQRGSRDRAETPVGRGDVPGIVGTFTVVTILWVFFRADSLSAGFEYLRGMFAFTSGSVPFDATVIVLSAAAVTLAIDLAARLGPRLGSRVPAVGRGLAYGLAAVGLVVFSGGEFVPFIYFQF